MSGPRELPSPADSRLAQAKAGRAVPLVLMAMAILIAPCCCGRWAHAPAVNGLVLAPEGPLLLAYYRIQHEHQGHPLHGARGSCHKEAMCSWLVGSLTTRSVAVRRLGRDDSSCVRARPPPKLQLLNDRYHLSPHRRSTAQVDRTCTVVHRCLDCLDLDLPS